MDSGVDSRVGAQTLIENNVFNNVKNPIETTLRGGLYVILATRLNDRTNISLKVPSRGTISTPRQLLILTWPLELSRVSLTVTRMSPNSINVDCAWKLIHLTGRADAASSVVSIVSASAGAGIVTTI